MNTRKPVCDNLPDGRTVLDNVFTDTSEKGGDQSWDHGINYSELWQANIFGTFHNDLLNDHIIKSTTPLDAIKVYEIDNTHPFLSLTPDVGDHLTYTVLFTDYGSVAANNVVVTDPVPVGLSDITDINHGGTVSNGIITWDLGTVNPGTIYKLTFDVTLTSHGEPVGWWTGNGTANEHAGIGNNDGIYPTASADPSFYTAGYLGFGCNTLAFNITTANGGVHIPIDFSSAANADLFSQQMSVVTWVKTTDTNGYQYIFDEGADSSYQAGAIGLYLGGNNHEVQFYIYNGQGPVSLGSTLFESPGDSISDGNWHQIVGTYNGNQLSLYVDGNLIGSTPITTSINYSTLVNHDLYIGTFPLQTTGASDPTYTFNGAIQDVQLYNSALTQGQIQVLDTNPTLHSGVITDTATATASNATTVSSSTKIFTEHTHHLFDKECHTLLEKCFKSNQPGHDPFPDHHFASNEPHTNVIDHMISQMQHHHHH